jgi:hypothetical protein
MDIKFTVDGTGPDLVNNYLIYRAAESSAPAAIVAQPPALAPPQAFPLTLFLNVPNPVPHIVEVYMSTDGVSLDQLLSSFLYEPFFRNVIIRLPVLLSVGGSGPHDPPEGSQTFPPIDGSTSVESIADWSGVSQWWPERRSVGGRMIPAEYVINVENTAFTLQGDDAFYVGDHVWICFPPKITISNPVFNSLKVFPKYRKVTGSITIDSSYLNAYIDLESTTPEMVIQLPSLATLPDNEVLTFFCMNGVQKQLTLRFFGAETVKWLGQDLSEVYMGRNEELWLYKRTDLTDPDNPVYYWHVAKGLEGMGRAGLRVHGETGLHGDPVLQPNLYALDGLGLTITEHPRAWWYVQQLPSALLVEKAVRDAGGDAMAALWAVDSLTTPTILYRPDTRGLVVRNLVGPRGNDSGRDNTARSGSYDGTHMMAHAHLVFKSQKISNGGFPPAPDASGSIATEFDKPTGGGRESYYLVKATAPGPADVGLSSEGGDRNEVVMKNYAAVEYVYL